MKKLNFELRSALSYNESLKIPKRIPGITANAPVPPSGSEPMDTTEDSSVGSDNKEAGKENFKIEDSLAYNLESPAQIYDLIRILVRFVGCLVNTGVVSLTGYLTLIKQFTGALKQASSLPYKDFLAFTVNSSV